VRITLDASTTLAAILPDEDSHFAEAAMSVAVRQGLVVPARWPYEIQNGLAMAVRRSRIEPGTLRDVLDVLRALQANLEPPQGLGQELRLAQAHELTAYDAAYLAVALSAETTLATNGQRLRRAAEAVGVALFKPGRKPDRQTRKRP